MANKQEVRTFEDVGGWVQLHEVEGGHHVMTLERFGTDTPLTWREGGVGRVSSTKKCSQCCRCLFYPWG